MRVMSNNSPRPRARRNGAGELRFPRAPSLSSRALHQKRGQQGNGPAGRSLFPARLPGRPGDVQVGPVVLAGEFRQETRRGYAARGTSADIRKIGEIAFQLLVVV